MGGSGLIRSRTPSATCHEFIAEYVAAIMPAKCGSVGEWLRRYTPFDHPRQHSTGAAGSLEAAGGPFGRSAPGARYHLSFEAEVGRLAGGASEILS